MTNASQPWSRWIGTETISELHAEVMRRWGGATGDPTPGCVDAALGAAFNAELYMPDTEQEGFLPGLLFAVYLLFYLVTKHCYIDGNKRLAWACMTFVLLSLDLTVAATEDEVVEFCLSVARGEIRSGAAVASWVSQRLVAIT